jgi:hypothetical protein
MVTLYLLDWCYDTYSRRYTKAKKVRVFPFTTKESLFEVLKCFIEHAPDFTYRVEVKEIDDEGGCKCPDCKVRIDFAQKNTLILSESKLGCPSMEFIKNELRSLV